MAIMKRKSITKSVGRFDYPAEDFAYVGDPKDPKTWKFLLTEEPGGDISKARLDKAVDAFGANVNAASTVDGTNGGAVKPQKYHIPTDAIDDVLNRLRDAWHIAYPDSHPGDMPNPLQDDGSNPSPDPTDPAAEMADELNADAGGADNTDPNAEEGADNAGDGTDSPDGADAASAAHDAIDNAVANPHPDNTAAAHAAVDAAAKPKKAPPKGKGKAPAKDKTPPGLVGKILKRYIDPAEGAMTFTDVLDCYEADKKYQDMMSAAWPLISALDTSLRSIIADQDVDDATRQNMLRSSVEGFLAGLKTAMPEVEGAVSKALVQAEKDEDNMVVKQNAGASASADVKKQLDALTAKVDEMTAAAATEKKAREKAEAELALTKKVADLTGDEREHYDNICKDAASKEKFLALDKSARLAEVKKAIASDEILAIEGQTILKSVVGDSMFAVLKASQARTTQLEKDFKVEREKREEVELTKRAETELAHLPGKLEDKVAFLKSLESMPEAQRTYAKNAFAAANKTASLAFQRMGTRATTVETLKSSGGSSFEKRVTDLQQGGMKRQEAMRKARQEDPDGFEAWQGEAN